MSDFVLTDEAMSDLFDIWSFVASDHPPAADKLEQDILKACARLSSQPSTGHFRRDLCEDPAVRFHTVRTWYLIVYEWDTQPLRIIRILHAARDASDELRVR